MFPEPLQLGGTEGGELESWIQWTHHFFSKIFVPAYEHMLLLRKEVEEERLREAAKARIALAKAREAAREAARYRRCFMMKHGSCSVEVESV